MLYKRMFAKEVTSTAEFSQLHAPRAPLEGFIPAIQILLLSKSRCRPSITRYLRLRAQRSQRLKQSPPFRAGVISYADEVITDNVSRSQEERRTDSRPHHVILGLIKAWRCARLTHTPLFILHHHHQLYSTQNSCPRTLSVSLSSLVVAYSS